MKQSLIEQLLFTFVMVIIMVYAMVCYNIAIETGQLSNTIFLQALNELVIMVPIALICEIFFVKKIALKLAFRIVDPKVDKQIFVTLVISAMIVCIMCPTMSFWATLLFIHPTHAFIANWFAKIIINFPMALGFQIFIAGPLVRNLFKLIY